MLKLILYTISLIFIVINFNTFVSDIRNIGNNYKNTNEDILNYGKYNDEFININNVLAVKREVFFYQWIEDKNVINKTTKYSYNKIWSNKLIDSSKFQDKTKINNNSNINMYDNKLYIMNRLKIKNNLIDSKYYKDKIKFNDYKIKNNLIFYGKGKKIIEKNKKLDYTDLDFYVSENNKVVEENRDRFISYKNILYNGKNYSEPEIGDIYIKYSVYKPNKICFYGDVSDKELKFYKNYINLSFDCKYNMKNIYKLKVIIFLISYTNILLLIIGLILNKLKETKDFTIKIPYINEYLIYSKNRNTDIICFFMIYLLFIFDFYYYTLIPIFIIYIERNIDYYSI